MRRFIPTSQVVLALIVSILSVSTAFFPMAYRAWNYRSQTHAFLLGAVPASEGSSNYVLLLAVTNNGGRPAVIGDRITISWRSVPLNSKELVILNAGERVVRPNETAVLRLTAVGLGLTDACVTKTPFGAALNSGTAVLTFNIEHTDRDGSRWEERDVRVQTRPTLIAAWIWTMVDIPPDPMPAAPAATSAGEPHA